MDHLTLIVPKGVGKLLSGITIPEAAEVLQRYQAVEVICKAIQEEVRRERRRREHGKQLSEWEKEPVQITVKLDLINQGLVEPEE